MPINYTVETNVFGKEIISYELNGSYVSFQVDLENPDYQEYLKSLEA
jgi:hypothetical protein